MYVLGWLNCMVGAPRVWEARGMSVDWSSREVGQVRVSARGIAVLCGRPYGFTVPGGSSGEDAYTFQNSKPIEPVNHGTSPYEVAQLWAHATQDKRPTLSGGKWSCGCTRKTGGGGLQAHDRDTLSWFLDAEGKWNLSPADLRRISGTMLKTLALCRFAGPGMGAPTTTQAARGDAAIAKLGIKELPRTVPSAKRPATKEYTWRQVWTRIPASCAGVDVAAALKARQPIQFAPRLPLPRAIDLWKEHPDNFGRHCPGASLEGNDRPIRGYSSRGNYGSGTPVYYFNDIVELFFAFADLAKDYDGDSFPQEIADNLATITYNAHVSWHIRCCLRFYGYELAEVLGSFDHQANEDRRVWQLFGALDEGDSVAFESLAPFLRCGVCACRCQYRLPTMGKLSFSYKNLGTELRGMGVVYPSLSDMAKEAFPVANNYGLYIGGLSSQRLLYSRIGPTLEKILSMRSGDRNPVLVMAKTGDLPRNRARRRLGPMSQRGQKRDVLDFKINIRSQESTAQARQKQRAPAQTTGLGPRNVRGATSYRDAARRGRPVSRDSSQQSERRTFGSHDERQVDVVPVGISYGPCRIATRDMSVDSTVPPEVAPHTRLTGAKLGFDGEGGDSRSRRNRTRRAKGQVEAAGNCPANKEVFRVARVQVRDLFNAEPTKRLARVRCQCAMRSQRSIGTVTPVYPPFAKGRCVTINPNNGKVSTTPASKAIAGGGTAQQVRFVSSKTIPTRAPTYVLNMECENKGIHKDGASANSQTRQGQSTPLNTRQAPRVQLAPCHVYKTPGVQPLRVENKRAPRNCEGAELTSASKSSPQGVEQIAGSGMPKSRLHKLGRACSAGVAPVGTLVLPAVFRLPARACSAVASPVAQQRQDVMRREIPPVRCKGQRRHEHRTRQLRASSFTCLVCPKHGSAECACRRKSSNNL